MGGGEIGISCGWGGLWDFREKLLIIELKIDHNCAIYGERE